MLFSKDLVDLLIVDPELVIMLDKMRSEIPNSLKSLKDSDGNEFMRIAGCNRKVQDQNGRALYRINLDNCAPAESSTRINIEEHVSGES